MKRIIILLMLSFFASCSSDNELKEETKKEILVSNTNKLSEEYVNSSLNDFEGEMLNYDFSNEILNSRFNTIVNTEYDNPTILIYHINGLSEYHKNFMSNLMTDLLTSENSYSIIEMYNAKLADDAHILNIHEYNAIKTLLAAYIENEEFISSYNVPGPFKDCFRSKIKDNVKSGLVSGIAKGFVSGALGGFYGGSIGGPPGTAVGGILGANAGIVSGSLLGILQTALDCKEELSSTKLVSIILNDKDLEFFMNTNSSIDFETLQEVRAELELNQNKLIKAEYSEVRIEKVIFK